MTNKEIGVFIRENIMSRCNNTVPCFSNIFQAVTLVSKSLFYVLPYFPKNGLLLLKNIGEKLGKKELYEEE